MARSKFHDVNIYWGTRLLTTSSRLEVAARSPFLQEVLTSIRMCDGCKEPTTLIFPAEDETQNTLQEMFKSLSVRNLLSPAPQAVSALKARLGETVSPPDPISSLHVIKVECLYLLN